MQRFDDLLIFVTVVERQSFVGAARQLDIPPGTVSRKIQELEARLGMTLLNRTTRRVAVTETGREVYEAASRGFAAIEEAEALARAHHDTPSGVLRVVAPYGFVHLALMPAIPEFRARFPEVRLEFIATNQALDLVENNCDVAIRVGAQRTRATSSGRSLISPTGSWLRRHTSQNMARLAVPPTCANARWPA